MRTTGNAKAEKISASQKQKKRSYEEKNQKPSVLTEWERARLAAHLTMLMDVSEGHYRETGRLILESVAVLTADDADLPQLWDGDDMRHFLMEVAGGSVRLRNHMMREPDAAREVAWVVLRKLDEAKRIFIEAGATATNMMMATPVRKDSELLYKFFAQARREQIQSEMPKLTHNPALLEWQNHIAERPYRHKDETSKMIALAREFYEITEGHWTVSDLLILKAALGDIGLAIRDPIGYANFVIWISSDKKLQEKLLGTEHPHWTYPVFSNVENTSIDCYDLILELLFRLRVTLDDERVMLPALRTETGLKQEFTRLIRQYEHHQIEKLFPKNSVGPGTDFHAQAPGFRTGSGSFISPGSWTTSGSWVTSGSGGFTPGGGLGGYGLGLI